MNPIFTGDFTLVVPDQTKLILQGPAEGFGKVHIFIMFSLLNFNYNLLQGSLQVDSFVFSYLLQLDMVFWFEYFV